MKFDVVIGNPPYQEASIGDSRQAPPIYHKFMDLSYEISDKVVLITPGRFLFNAGATGNDWNQKMLNDEHLSVIFYEQNSAKIFPNTDIKGGVAVTYRNAKEKFEKIECFTAYKELTSILKKIRHLHITGINTIMYGQNTYKFTSVAHEENPTMIQRLSKGHSFDITTSVFDKLPDVMLDNKPNNSKENYVRIYGRQNNERVFKWVKAKYIAEHDSLNKYKVFVPKSNGSGRNFFGTS